MSNPPLRRGPLLVWLLRLLPPLAIFLGSAELYVRYFVYDTIYRDNACIAYRREGEDPLAPHRFFRPICRVRVESVNGGEFEIVTNEDGLRDRPRAEFRDGAIAIQIGRAHV